MAIASPKRFYSACCFMIVFSVCYNALLLKSVYVTRIAKRGVMLSSKEASIPAKSVTVPPASLRLSGPLPCDNSDFYTADCWLKSFRKRWVTTEIKRRQTKRGKADCQRFVSPHDFIQSLALLICCAWCAVVSGVIISILSLSQINTPRVWLPTLGLLARLTLAESKNHNHVHQCLSFYSAAQVQPSTSQQCETLPMKGHMQQSIFIHLDCILAIISMMLLRSGDVELNPGPPKDRKTNDSNKAEPNEPQASFSKVTSQNLASAYSDMDGLPVVNITPVTLESDESGSAPSTLRELHHNSIESHQPENDLMTNGTLKVFEDKAYSQVEDDSTPPMYNAFSKNAEHYSQASDYVEDLQDMPDYHEVEDHLNTKKFTEQVNNELDLLEPKGLHKSFAKDHLDDCTVAFFGHANSLYRAGCRCKYCSICGSRKRDVATKDHPSGEYRSHVFPNGILKVFGRIHCYNSSSKDQDSSKQKQLKSDDHEERKLKEFIYDFVLDKRLGASAWHYQLHCSCCEKKCQPAEEKLRDVYVDLMRHDVAVSFENENYWFNYILAVIMFRGLLVCEKLNNCFNNTCFKAGFTELWTFCKSDIGALEITNLRLFLLPNRPINKEKAVFLYPLENVLRCPTFTRFVTSSENGTFFYCKFDCFHVVYTLDDISRQYFNHFLNILHVLETPEKHLILQWTNWGSSSIAEKSAASKAIRVIYNPDTALLFPPALFEENIRLSVEVTKKIYHLSSVPNYKPKLLSTCKIMTERHKGLGHQYTPQLDTTIAWDAERSIPPSESIPVHFGKTSRRQFHNKYIEEAAYRSPLRLPEKLSHENEIQELRSSLADKEKEVYELKTKADRNTKKVDKRDDTIMLLLKQIRISQRQKTECQGHSPTMLRTGKTTLENCMELRRKKGFYLSRQQWSTCSDVLQYTESEIAEDFRPVEYLDLALINDNASCKRNHRSFDILRSITC